MDVQHVARFYHHIDKKQLHKLPEIYHHNVVFEDPAHRIQGVQALTDYFATLYQNVERCSFVIDEQYSVDEGAFLIWTMYLRHPKLAKGQPVRVNGVSYLRFADDKVIYHRDYFDMGQMLYERLPILGSLIRTIKRRLGQ